MNKLDSLRERISEAIADPQDRVLVASRKLEALGAILERQGEDCEGFTELHGLGTLMREMSDGLLQTWRDLDPVNLFPKRPKPRRDRRALKKDPGG